VISGDHRDIRNVSYLAHFLFDFDDELAPTHWEDIPYCELYRRLVAELRIVDCEAAKAQRDRQSSTDGSREDYSRITGSCYVRPGALICKAPQWKNVCDTRSSSQQQSPLNYIDRKRFAQGRDVGNAGGPQAEHRTQRKQEECMGGLRRSRGRKIVEATMGTNVADLIETPRPPKSLGLDMLYCTRIEAGLAPNWRRWLAN